LANLSGILATLPKFLYSPKKAINFICSYILLRGRNIGAAKSWQLSYKYKLIEVCCEREKEGQHPLTGQRAANFRLLANQ